MNKHQVRRSIPRAVGELVLPPGEVGEAISTTCVVQGLKFTKYSVHKSLNGPDSSNTTEILLTVLSKLLL